MPAEGFFHRWSRLKADAPATVASPEDVAMEQPGAPAPRAAAVPAAQDDRAGAPGPTLGDVALLGADADYSAFVARGVDASVRRSAMKKLFSDPHFNIGDGLDLYMGDYNKPDPVSAAMLAALDHSKSFFAQAFPDKANADAAHGEGEPRRAAEAEAEADPTPGQPAPGVPQPQPATTPHMNDNTAAARGATGDSA